MILMVAGESLWAQARPVVDSPVFYQTWQRDYDKESRLARWDDYTKNQMHKRRSVQNHIAYEEQRGHFLKGVRMAPHRDMWGRRKVPAPSWIHLHYGARW